VVLVAGKNILKVISAILLICVIISFSVNFDVILIKLEWLLKL